MNVDTAAHRWFRSENLRFSLRKLLVVMLACSVVFAIVGPAIRGLDREQRIVASVCVAVFAAAAVVTVALQATLILWRIRRSGAVLVEVPTAGSYRQAPHPMLAIIGILIWSTLTGLGILAAAWSVQPWSGGPPAPGLIQRYPLLNVIPFFMLFTGWMIATEAGWLWVRKKSFQDLWCENGIVSGPLTFVPWSEVRIISWNERSGMLILGVRDATFRILLPEDKKANLMRVLQERLVSDETPEYLGSSNNSEASVSQP